MIRRTLGDVKDAIAKVIGTCGTDPQVRDYINQATEVFMNWPAKWVGTYQRIRICADPKGCITWPRQIATIEAWAECDCPGIIRNQWFEFQANGSGLLDSTDNVGLTLLDRGQACTFDDITGDDKVLKVYADLAEAADAYLIAQGYDQNNNWIQTEYPALSGIYIDGERILISTTPQTSTKIFKQGSPTAILKPVTNGPVRLFQFQPSTGGQKALGIYEPSETRPNYRRSQVPNLSSQCSCGPDPDGDDDSCDKKQITVMAKLQFIPVLVDNDWLFISNLAALKLMVQSIIKKEQNLFGEAKAYEADAISQLQHELQTYEGDGAVQTPRFQSRYEWGAGAIMNVV